MLHSGGVKKVPDDGALGIDAISVRGRGAGKVQLSEGTALVQKAVSVS